MKKEHSVLKTIVVVLVLTIVFIASSRHLVTWEGFYGKNLRVPYDGDTSRSQLIDDRDIIDSDEEKRLNKLIKEHSKKLEMNIIIFVSGTPVSDSRTKDFAADTYEALMEEANTDGLLYYMDFSGKKPAYDYLWVSGSAATIFPHDISEVTDKIIPYLPSSSKANITQKDIIPGIEYFLEVAESYVDSYSQSDLHYEKDPDKGLYFFDTGEEFYVSKRLAPGARFIRFMIAYFVSLITTLVVYFIVKSKYKFKDKTDPGIYIARGETVYSVKTDTFIRSYTTKTSLQSSSGGGGGHRSGGGGGHSGGGRGGGSHR